MSCHVMRCYVSVCNGCTRTSVRVHVCLCTQVRTAWRVGKSHISRSLCCACFPCHFLLDCCRIDTQMSYAAPSRLKAPVSSAANAPNRSTGAPRSKIERYRPGVVPVFGDSDAKLQHQKGAEGKTTEEEEEEEKFVFLRPGALAASSLHGTATDKPRSASSAMQPEMGKQDTIAEFSTTTVLATIEATDPRLARLGGASEHRASRARPTPTTMAADAPATPSAGQPPLSAMDRRRKMKEAALLKQHEELSHRQTAFRTTTELELEPESESESESESQDEPSSLFQSEFGADSVEELGRVQPLFKPMFVAKENRTSLSMEEKLEQEQLKELERLAEIEKRKQASKDLLVQTIQKELLDETELCKAT